MFEQPQEVGTIRITRNVVGETICYEYEWQGGDVVAVTLELLMQGSPEIAIIGDLLRIGPYYVKPLGFKVPSAGLVLLCRRVVGV